MSELYTARAGFALEQLDKVGSCSGCSRRFKVGESAYVRRYDDPRNRTRQSRSILCNLEECWMEWDEKVYTGLRAARKAEAGVEARIKAGECFGGKVHYSRVK